MFAKYLTIWANYLKIRVKMDGAQCVQHHMKTFFGGNPKGGVHDLCGRKYSQKSCPNFSGKFGEIRTKIFRIPENLAAPTPMHSGTTVSR